MGDIRIRDMYSHFIYEEFHPNDEDDVHLWSSEFLDAFFKEGTKGFIIPIGDKELYDANGSPITQEELRQQIDEFHQRYTPSSRSTTTKYIVCKSKAIMQPWRQ